MEVSNSNDMEPRNPRLIIGPWIGEFGVELLRWQGLARAIACKQNWSEIIVLCQNDRRWFYADFATKFIDYEPRHHQQVGRYSGGHENISCAIQALGLQSGDRWLNPNMRALEWHRWKGTSVANAKYRCFAERAPVPMHPVQLMFHARATNKAGQQFKNWPFTNFAKLVEALPSSLTCASIGSIRDAHHIDGTVDLRGLPLDELAGYCAAAKAIIGPSSGPIHYAMHCGTAALTWIAQKDLHCYFPQLNPFDVPLCCLPTWQPKVEIVLHKLHELLKLVDTRSAPVKWCVFGTKRSGHHGFIEWLVKLHPQVRVTHLNDCNSLRVMTPPAVKFWIPTAFSQPKELNKPAKNSSVVEWNPQGRSPARLLSFEGLPVEHVCRIPEAANADKLIFVLRDSANMAASAQKGLPHLSGFRFTESAYLELVDVYRGQLLEALGQSSFLGDLASKALFVSYNRWHADAGYRRWLSTELGGNGYDPERDQVSSYAHKSGFESSLTNASDLGTMSRWENQTKDNSFWLGVMDPELYAAEAKFHACNSPLSDSIFD